MNALSSPIHRRRYAAPVQSVQQRFKKILIGTPASDRAPVYRLTHLKRAGSTNWPQCRLKLDARGVPIEFTVGDQPSRLTLQVRNYIFVFHFEHKTKWKDIPPVLHKSLICSVVP